MRIQDAEFAEYYSARFDTARRMAYALCADWTEAEELTQHAFVRLYDKWSRIRDGNADGYLRTIQTRLFLDTRRRGRRREQLVAETPEHPQPRFPETERVAERQSLVAALQTVPARQRATLVLRIVHDLPVEQVATILGCSTGTVKSQFARGMQTFRAAYGAAEKVGANNTERSTHDVG